jgi:hypothetical protein
MLEKDKQKAFQKRKAFLLMTNKIEGLRALLNKIKAAQGSDTTVFNSFNAAH